MSPALVTFAKKLAVDTVESFIGVVLGLQLVAPTSLADLKGIAVALYLALLAGAVSAFRRNAPGFVIALREALGVRAG